MRVRFIFCIIMIVVLSILLESTSARAAQRCFAETSQCIDGRVREFWEQNGGLLVFGLPICAQEAVSVDGSTFIAQRFERNRLELHPVNARPYEVLFGRLGADRLSQQGIDWTTYPSQGVATDCQYFSQTKQSVCGLFLRAYRQNGLQMDGMPRSAQPRIWHCSDCRCRMSMSKTLSNGQRYQVQWFERAAL